MNHDNKRILELSKHLFWEYDVNSLTWVEDKSLIILRVLEYGLENDWKILKEVYSLEEIKEVCVEARSIDPVALNFVSVITHTPLSEFKCYKLRQSIPHYSGY